ncbi:MAG: type IV secretion protein Rhs [Hamadaea sp.]|nr:type IV secretion protein Rhs [Hamadaea sp.]
MTAVTPHALTVTVQGAPLPPSALTRLVGVRVSARLDQPGQCELTFTADPGSGADPAMFPLGATLAVRLDDTTGDLFAGEVTAVEVEYAADGAPLLRARAYDPLHRLRKHQELRVFESVTVSDLAGELAGKVGLTVDAADDDGGPRVERLLQHRQTDLELLVEVAGRAGLHLAVDGDTLRLITLDGYGFPVPLDLGKTLLGVRVEANLDQAAGDSTALGWHPQRAELIEQSAGSARSGRRIPLRPDPGDVGAGGTRTAVNQPGRSDDELAALAQAWLDTRTAAWVTATGTADGDGRLRPGRRIAIGGVAERFCGAYVLTEVVHTIDAAGHLTRFSTEPPPMPAQSSAAVLTLGSVTDVDDPDRLGRVRVDLPAYGGLDAGWLALALPGAGRGKGIVALPDPADTVLVALPGGEPAAGIVLGSLFGTVEPYDAGINDGKAQRWSMRTAYGQQIVVDDGGRSLRLETEVGSYLELTPDLTTLHAATPLVLQAPGKAMVIRARTVDFQHADAPEDPQAAADQAAAAAKQSG